MPGTDHGIPFPHSLNNDPRGRRSTRSPGSSVFPGTKCRTDRQPSWHPHHDQRIPVAFTQLGPLMKAQLSKTHLLHRYLRPLRLRQRRVNRNADRRQSEPSSPTAAMILPNSVSAPCSQEPWPTSCPPAIVSMLITVMCLLLLILSLAATSGSCVRRNPLTNVQGRHQQIWMPQVSLPDDLEFLARQSSILPASLFFTVPAVQCSFYKERAAFS